MNRKLSSRINLCLFFLYSAFISKVNVLWNAPFCTIYMVFPCCTKFHFREMMIRWNFYRGKLITILLKIDLIVLIASYTAVSNSPRKKYYIVFLLNSICFGDLCLHELLLSSMTFKVFSFFWLLKYMVTDNNSFSIVLPVKTLSGFHYRGVHVNGGRPLHV